MSILTIPFRFITNYSFMKTSRVHNLFKDYYEYFVQSEENLEKKVKFVSILTDEIGKCYVEDLRLYIKRKAPDHQLLNYLEQTNSRYFCSSIYDNTGVCPFDSEGIYNAVLKIYQNYCENEKDMIFIIDVFKTKLGPNHAASFSDFLYNCVPSNPLISKLLG